MEYYSSTLKEGILYVQKYGWIWKALCQGEISQIQKDKYGMISLKSKNEIVKLIEAESEMGIVRD